MESKFYASYNFLFHSYRNSIVSEDYPLMGMTLHDRLFYPLGGLHYSRKDLVVHAVEQVYKAIETNGKNLRPDAKLYLLKNCIELILLPILYSELFLERASEKIHSEETIAKIIKELLSDVAAIIKQAEETRSMASKDNISSHDIMRAMQNKWDELKTMRREIWG